MEYSNLYNCRFTIHTISRPEPDTIHLTFSLIKRLMAKSLFHYEIRMFSLAIFHLKNNVELLSQILKFCLDIQVLMLLI